MEIISNLQETKNIQNFSLENFLKKTSEEIEKINYNNGTSYKARKGFYGVVIFNEKNECFEHTIFTYENLAAFIKKYS